MKIPHLRRPGTKIPKLWSVPFDCGHTALFSSLSKPRGRKLECPGCQTERTVVAPGPKMLPPIPGGPFELAAAAARFKKERDNLRKWMKWILEQKPGDVGAGRLPVWIEKTLRSALDGNAPLPLRSRRKVR